MIDRARHSPEFLDWLDGRGAGERREVEAKAREIAEGDAGNDGVRHRDYWRRRELVKWCEANRGFKR